MAIAGPGKNCALIWPILKTNILWNPFLNELRTFIKMLSIYLVHPFILRPWEGLECRKKFDAYLRKPISWFNFQWHLKKTVLIFNHLLWLFLQETLRR